MQNQAKVQKRIRPRKARRGTAVSRRGPNRYQKRFPGALVYMCGIGQHNPFPQIFVTKFTASGSCYTASGAGTGDYQWALPMNYMYHPFSGMTTGVTWNNLTPSTYNPIGYSALVNGNLFTRTLVFDTLLEIDVTQQSVVDSVTLACTASDVTSAPATLGAALIAPYTKQMTFSSGRTQHRGDFQFRYRMAAHRYLGYPTVIYDNDTSGNYSASYSGMAPSAQYLVLNLETGDNSTLSAPIEIRIRQTFWVKLYQLDTSAMLTMPVFPRRLKRCVEPVFSSENDRLSMEELKLSPSYSCSSME